MGSRSTQTVSSPPMMLPRPSLGQSLFGLAPASTAATHGLIPCDGNPSRLQLTSMLLLTLPGSSSTLGR